MDNMVKQYIDVAGTYTEVAAEGNIVIRVPGVTLDGVDIDGDLVIGDGVGNGDAILKNITVEGRAVIRGGGENSVKFIGTNTDVKNIVIARGSDGRVRILTEDGAVLAEAEVDGDSDVILEGEFENVTVMSDAVTVTALNATITSMSIPGEDSVVILSGTSTVETASISGTQSELVVQEGASVDTVKISAPSVTVSGEGTVEDVEVQAGGDEASITTPNTVTTVSSDVEGVTAGGEDVPAGGTATNNSTGTDATVTKPSTGGNTGGPSTPPTPNIDIVSVTSTAGSVGYVYPRYTIPVGADQTNTEITVSITNTSAVNYTAELTIENGGSVVAYAKSTAIQKIYLDLLNNRAVRFSDIGLLFDRIGTVDTASYYYDASSTKVLATTPDQPFFEASIIAMFARMGVGDVYTVTVKLTPAGGTADEVVFEVTK